MESALAGDEAGRRQRVAGRVHARPAGVHAVDAVLSTRCEVGGDGRYTGQVGENCKGEEKVRRIKQYLKENGFVLDMKCSSAYGDSPSDADMMALVNRAVLVNPKKALLRRRPGRALSSTGLNAINRKVNY